MIYAKPGSEGSVVSFQAEYGNYIGGEWVPPVKGQYFDNISPKKISTWRLMLPTRQERHGAKLPLLIVRICS